MVIPSWNFQRCVEVQQYLAISGHYLFTNILISCAVNEYDLFKLQLWPFSLEYAARHYCLIALVRGPNTAQAEIRVRYCPHIQNRIR